MIGQWTSIPQLRYQTRLSDLGRSHFRVWAFHLRDLSVRRAKAEITTSIHIQISPFKPSLRVSGDPEGPHVIGRESDSQRFDWLDYLARFAPSLKVNVCGP